MPVTAANAATDRAFLDDIAANPTDPGVKGVYADWLEKQGEPDLAFAFRWAAKHGRHPWIDPDHRFACWQDMHSGQRKPAYPDQLPIVVWVALKPDTKPGRGGRYRTLRVAFQRLAMALKTLRDAVAC